MYSPRRDVPLARLQNVLVAAKVLEQSLPRINILEDVPLARLYNVIGRVNNPHSHCALRNNRKLCASHSRSLSSGPAPSSQRDD
jgi:hypothetical protein